MSDEHKAGWRDWGPCLPWLGLLLALCLPFLGLAAPPSAARERWERLAALPASGAVRQIVVDRAGGQVSLYAVVDRWGIYRSPDGGHSWQSLGRELPRGPLGQSSVGSLACAGSRCLLVAVASPVGEWRPWMFKSGDGGRTWVRRRGLGVDRVDALAVAPGHAVYAASANQLYRSADGGDTWLQAGHRPTGSAVLAMAVEPTSGALYAGTRSDGLWITEDQGASWRAALAQRTVYAIAFAGQDWVYAAADDGLYHSADQGASWRRLPAPLGEGPVIALAVDPATPSHLFVALSTGPVRHSADGGQTWRGLSYTLLNAPVTSLALSGARQLYVGTRAGLWRCTLPLQDQADPPGEG